MMYKTKTECIYCYEVYRVEDHDTCPNCAVNPQTKGITIIELTKEENEDDN
jgi:rRNA maturation endonuclease Nob1